MHLKKFDTEEILIKEVKSFQQFIRGGNSLKNCTLQDLDFTSLDINWKTFKFNNTTFLGCLLKKEDKAYLEKKGAIIFPCPPKLPYYPFRKSLYQWQELMEGFSPKKDNSVDYHVYRHFSKSKFNPSINEALWQRIHDHAMDDALRDLIVPNHNGMTEKKCVGFMGGHGTLRTDEFYTKTALTAKLLAEAEYFVVSGGGPGIMEATNLGAYFAKKSNKKLLDAISILQKAPHFSDKNFHIQSMKVLEKYPKGGKSLAIPTWFYGHEPSNLFASHIAKYFSNSIREDTLLAISLYGIICSPGSAGTTQEIFMDATQNHYGTFNYLSPMVFLGKKRYEIDTMIYPLLKQLSYGKKYHDLLYLSDEPKEILAFLKDNPPVKK